MPPDRATGYSGRSVVVTGGASFLGSHLVEQLLDYGADVTVVDDFSSGSEANLAAVSADVQILAGDVRDPAIIARATYGRDMVFHLAAIHGGRGFVDTHGFDCLSNLALDNSVFRAAAHNDVQRVVFASSACVYPTSLQDATHEPYLLREEDADPLLTSVGEPDGDYGRAKLVGELQLKSMQRDCGVEGIACRLFSVYGPRQTLSHSVAALIVRAIVRQDPYVIWGPGKQTRNFTYVADSVRGLLLAGVADPAVDAVNIGTDTHVSVDVLRESIFEVACWRPSRVVHQESQPVGVLHRAADRRRAAAIGWRAEVPLTAGLELAVEWYRKAGPQLTDEALFTQG